MSRSRFGRRLAKGLGICLEHDTPRIDHDLVGVGLNPYVGRDPTPGEWIKEAIPGGAEVSNYFRNLFAFLQWMPGYNRHYFYGDVVAGITVGAVLVPESTAYARLAGLNPQFGLYTGFVGSLTYWLFGTSKDIQVGPVAVLAAISGNVVASVVNANPDLPPHAVASALALVSGGIVCGLGVLRLGFLVDLIPQPSIMAFMTGAALSISSGQLPALFGIPHHASKLHEPFVNTGDPTYRIIINTIKDLHEARIDASLGLTSLFALYMIRYIATTLAKRFPSKASTILFVNSLRITFIILLYTLVSWLTNRTRRTDPMFSLLGTVPSGFRNLGVPIVNTSIVKSFASKLPVMVIVILLEHTAAAKTFGRINNYTINPSQEVLASGVANIFGAFFGGFAVTGSFTRTAISARAGVRTPLSGVVVALVLLLSIYLLTAVFFYIPNSVLSAVIIHAVCDLIVLPEESYRLWRISPVDFIIFIIGVILAVFTSVEVGIYVTVSVSAGVLGFRLMKAPGRFLGKIKIHSMIDQNRVPSSSSLTALAGLHEKVGHDALDELSERNIFLPIGHEDGTNPEVNFDVSIPGIFVYRFSENFNYTNASHYLDQLLHTVHSHTQRSDPNSYKSPGDRPWNVPKDAVHVSFESEKPHLKSIILDFSAVNNVDSTSVTALDDLRNQLDRYAAPDTVSWHFAHITNRWTKKALTAVGFGYNRDVGFGAEEEHYREKGLRPIYNIAHIDEIVLIERKPLGDATGLSKNEKDEKGEAVAEESERRSGVLSDAEVEEGAVNRRDQAEGSDTTDDTIISEAIRMDSWGRGLGRRRKGIIIHGVERPYFHIDLTSALQSAVAEIRHKEMMAGIAERVSGVLP